METALTLLSNRLDVIITLIAFIAVAIVFRRREFLAFPLAFLPWLLLNITSVDPSKKVLGIYLLFPTIIYMTGPVLAMALRSPLRTRESIPRSSIDPVPNNLVIGFSYLFATLALFLGGVAAPPSGFGAVYYSMLRQPLIGPGEMRLTDEIVRAFARESGVTAVDAAVMSLNPVVLESTNLLSRVEDKSTIDALLFNPQYLIDQHYLLDAFGAWIKAGKHIELKCLPGGMVRADARMSGGLTGQTEGGQLNRALRCHPRPKS